MFRSEKIYNVYEKPEAAEPTQRVELVREGFSFVAFVFNLLWLLYHRLWMAAAAYMALLVFVALAAEWFGISELGLALAQLWLQVMIAFHAADLRGRALVRRGYRMAGVLAATTDIEAERRYHEFAA